MQRRAQHTVDFIFPIALFFVFSVSALVALLLAANIYGKQVTRSEASFQQSTALSYVTEKIRQADEGGISSVSIRSFDGSDVLAISQEYNGQSYTTYIYETDGALKELFTQSDVPALYKAGTTILQIQKLQIKELSEGLFQFTCISQDGTSDSVTVGIHSR